MSKTIFLTSSLDLSREDENGIKRAHKFTDKNHIQDNFKKHIKKYDNFLYIASIEDDFQNNDEHFERAKQSFNMTIPFKNYFLLDGRTKEKAKKFINMADFIFLCGGHVPTQNKFFAKIKLDELLKNYNGVICGSSAGSMNSAKVVYSAPELDGEAIDPNYKRYLSGLGLTTINIIPHFDDIKNTSLDGKHVLNDILLPDSFKNEIYAYSDGTYIMLNDNIATVFGEAYLIKNGKIKKLCKRKKKLNIKKRDDLN